MKQLSVEGQLELSTLLFVPRRALFDTLKSNKKCSNFELYIRRVFITNGCESAKCEIARKQLR